MAQSNNGTPIIRTADGLVGLCDVRDFGLKGAYEPMRKRGIVCEDHGPMKVESLKAKHNPTKVCDDRCVSAKRASCECSCGGVNHGTQF